MIKKLFFIALVIFSLKISASPPILSNFRVENTHKNRVYFDSSELITGTTYSGFTISGKTISGITINSGYKIGHYLTVSSPFTFWDNNTIMFSVGSNIQNINGNPLLPFDLQYIVNNITEPLALVNRYASLTGSGSHDGKSEANAWTLKEAASKATAGQTVWVKAGGNFGGVTFKNNGTLTNPIKVKGYINDIGDLDGVSFHTYSIGSVIDNKKAPTLSGPFGNSNDNGFTISGDYIIVENFQSHGWKRNFYSTNNAGNVISNCVSHKTSIGQNPSPDGYGFFVDSNRTRIINSMSINSDMGGIFVFGNHNLIMDCKTYTDLGAPGGDYFYSIRGSHNIVRGCQLRRTQKGANGQHGFSVKGEGIKTEYNLIENGIAWSSSFPIEARHDEVKFNVFRNISINSDPLVSNQGNGGAIMMMNGPSNNIFDNITVTNGEAGIRFLSSGEDIEASQAGENNIFKNCNFNGNLYGITISEDSGKKNRVTSKNTIINCNFYNNNYMFNITTTDVKDNIILNCNIVNTKKKEYKGNNPVGFTYSNSNFFNNTNFSFPSGNGNLSLDPKFIDASNGNFRLMPDSPIIDKGKESLFINSDADGNSRPQGSGIEIGAFEFQDNSTGSINPNAGPDVDHCIGEETTLTASGNGTFLWNTGETSASIVVSPEITTTFTVTVTNDEGNSDSDDVTVNVVELPTVNAGPDQTICSGEEVILTATGEGNFLWSTGETTSSISVSPTSTTTYTVTSSNSCLDVATDQIIVNVTPSVNLTVDSDVEICLGESVTLTAQSNGDFLWNTGETTASITVSPASTTIYSIISSLGECSKTVEVSVTVNQAASVNAGPDQTICSGEEVILTATGEGNFLWSTDETTSSISVSPTNTTTYTVTASNSCAEYATDQVIVTVNDKPILTLSEDVTIESGSSTELTAAGDGNILWSTGEITSSITVNPETTTTYTVSLITTEGCSVEDNVEVLVENSSSSDNSETTIIADAGEDVYACLDSNTELTATGGGLYLWSTGEVTETITVSPNETTTYYVTVSDGINIDITDVDEVTVYVDEGCSDLVNRPATEEFKVYPNPTNGILHIEIVGYSNELNISLFNSTGKIIYSENINNYSLDKSLKRNINLRKFGKGIYYARIFNNGENITKKVIVI